MVAGRVYVVGGVLDDGEFKRMAGLQCYDVVAGRWDGMAALGWKVWAVGGRCESPNGLLMMGEQASVEVYCPLVNRWTEGGALQVR